MPALSYPKYGLDALFLFPYFHSREEFERLTGQECPPWNSMRAPKYWFDPQALKSNRPSVVYQQALATDDRGTPIRGSDGRPVLDLLVLSRTEAATVNIPTYLPGVPAPGGAAPEVQPPLRPLEPEEELFFDGPLGVVAVRNNQPWPRESSGFSDQDRRLLQAIAAKLGVTP